MICLLFVVTLNPFFVHPRGKHAGHHTIFVHKLELVTLDQRMSFQVDV